MTNCRSSIRYWTKSPAQRVILDAGTLLLEVVVFGTLGTFGTPVTCGFESRQERFPMAKIAILPDVLCNQIAAGEVVERPAAVVKELMENSIDANSRTISVRLLDAGRKEIGVVDNGEGMSPDDALLAIERHATSKIRSAADLDHIQSLGFRGEALPSIAAVSRFELLTREREATSGTRLIIEGGVLKGVREAGCPAGTQLLVRDLFPPAANSCARKKLKWATSVISFCGWPWLTRPSTGSCTIKGVPATISPR
jgi:hypothetical protein